ncbi:hypothetical protein ACWEIJ_45930 [Lentzea sp. NPDC004789]
MTLAGVIKDKLDGQTGDFTSRVVANPAPPAPDSCRGRLRRWQPLNPR